MVSSSKLRRFSHFSLTHSKPANHVLFSHSAATILSGQFMINYKSLTWMIRPSWVGFPHFHHLLGCPTGGKGRYKLPTKSYHLRYLRKNPVETQWAKILQITLPCLMPTISHLPKEVGLSHLIYFLLGERWETYPDPGSWKNIFTPVCLGTVCIYLKKYILYIYNLNIKLYIVCVCVCVQDALPT